MAADRRYAKTQKGIDEITQRLNNLRGKMRMMLILIDATKTTEQLRAHAAQLGLPEDFLEVMVREGYIAPVEPRATSVPAPKAAAHEEARVAKAKVFMKETLTAGLGQRASDLRARIERASTRAELAQLVPAYEKAIADVSGDVQADLLADRLRKLLS